MAEQQGVPVKDSDLTQWKEKKNQGKLAAQQLHLQCEDWAGTDYQWVA